MSIVNLRDLLKAAWRAYRANFLTFVGIFAVPVLFMIAALLVGGLGVVASVLALDTAAALGSGIVVGIFALILFLLVSSWASAAAISVAKAREERIGIKEAFKRSRPLILPFIWVSLLAGLAPLGGFLLFFVPGILIALLLNEVLGGLLMIPGIFVALWLVVLLSLSQYALVGEGKRGVSALRRSKELVGGIWWSIALRFAVISAVGLIASLLFTIILRSELSSLAQTLFVTPFTVAATYLLYENVRSVRDQGGEVRESAFKNAASIILLAVGILVLYSIFGAASLFL